MSPVHCPRCGADLSAAPDGRCPACVAPPEERQAKPAGAVPGRTPEEAARIEAYRQWQAKLRQLTPSAPVTPILVLLNVGVFVAMAVAGAAPWNPTVDTLLAWGADHGPTTFGGEWWRLFTAAFLHSGLPHLAFNMLCLYGAGVLAERMLGGAGFLLTYLASALAGSLASVAWSPTAVSVGASGAVFGLFGANFAATLRAGDTIPPPMLRGLQVNTAKLLALNFAIGFFSPNVDVAAHVGGLICGFVAGFVLGHPLRRDAARRRMVRNLAAVLMLAPLLGLVAVVASGRVATADDVASQMRRIGEEEERILTLYNDTQQRAVKGELDDLGFLAVLDRDILPPWANLRQRFAAIRGAGKLDTPLGRLFGDYLEARGEGLELFRKALAAGDLQVAARSREKMSQADALVVEIKRDAQGRK